VVNAQLPESELERLLLTLLRLVSPAAGTDAGVVTPAAPGGPPVAALADRVAGSGAAATPGSAEPVTIDGPAVPPLSSSEARALIELGSAHGIAQGQLGGLLGLEKSTVSRLAASLEHKGWIRRGRDQGDQRYVRLYLTAQGAAVARQVWQAWQSRQARILACLSAEERRGLAAGLRGLIRGLAAEGLLGEQYPDLIGEQGPGHAVRI
jgi:DNA-binding MarR family transcriptional regulator